jgi:SHS2 domain-containing protein
MLDRSRMYRWRSHTGEAELEIEAPSEEAVFRVALAALCELLAEDEAAGPPITREVTVHARDRPSLLADWLAELAFLAETESFVPDSVEALELGDGWLRATVSGHRANPPHLVKAVTYHGLSLAPRGGSWYATVVLDV